MFLITSNSSTLRPDAADTSSCPTISDRDLLAASGSLTQPSSNEAIVDRGRFESKTMGNFQVELAETAEAILASDTNSRKRSRNTGEQSGLAATLSSARLDTEHSKSDICLKSGQSCPLEQHEVKSSDNHRLDCTFCGRKFKKRHHFEQHMITHDDTRHFLCESCGSGFKRNSDLGNHKKYCHGNKRVFKCDTCGHDFQNKYDLFRHKVVHDDARPFLCGQCGKSFKRQSDLVKHEITHTDKRPFQCEQCGETFNTTSNLTRHRRGHSDERPFQCEHCKKTFKRKDELVNHEQTHGNNHPLKCSECDKSFKIKSRLARHQKTHNNKHPFQCDKCDKSFKHRASLTQHEKTHNNKHPFQCNKCDKSFKHRASLTQHEKTHNNKHHFKCDKCDAYFKRQGDLTRHLYNHDNDSHFKSDTVNVAITEDGILAKHKETHTGQHLHKPNKSKTFTNDKISNQPEPGHDSEESSQSSHCDADSTSEKTLNHNVKQKNHTTHSETRLTDSGNNSATSQLPFMINQTSPNDIHADKSQEREEYTETLVLLDEFPDTYPVMSDLELGEYHYSLDLEKKWAEITFPDQQVADDTYSTTPWHSVTHWPSTSAIDANTLQNQEKYEYAIKGIEEIDYLQTILPTKPSRESSWPR